MDLEWYALCSHRPCCSVPLEEFFSKLLQPITEQINNKPRFGFLVASSAFGSEALSWDLQFGVLDSVKVLSCGGRSAHVAAGPLNSPTLGARRVGSFTELV